jgi:hypothetical protein
MVVAIPEILVDGLKSNTRDENTILRRWEEKELVQISHSSLRRWLKTITKSGYIGKQ